MGGLGDQGLERLCLTDGFWASKLFKMKMKKMNHISIARIARARGFRYQKGKLKIIEKQKKLDKWNKVDKWDKMDKGERVDRQGKVDKLDEMDKWDEMYKQDKVEK